MRYCARSATEPELIPRLRRQLERLDARHSAFEADTRSLSEAQLRFRPTANSWSIAEVAHHLLQVEREVVKAASKSGVERRGRKRSPANWAGYVAFLAVVHLHARVRVPRAVADRVTPAADPEMDRIWSEWSDVRARLRQYLETVGEANLREMAFMHPIIGPTMTKGMVPFLLKHFSHHMRQVERIRWSPGFPDA